MKVFFDNCTSPVFAGCLNALIQPDGDEARHVRFMPDYGFTNKTDDVDWITRLGADPASWILITGDQRIRKNEAELRAWIRAGLKAFVLAPAYQKTPNQPLRCEPALALAGDADLHFLGCRWLDVRTVD